MIKIPSTDKKFSQPNRGNLLGNLWSTFNIDFQDNLGAIRVGQRMKIISKTGDTNCTNLGVPTSFTVFGSHVACLAGTRVFKSDKLTPDMVFSEDTLATAHTNYSVDTDDMAAFNGALVTYNGTDGKIYSLDTFSSGTWTQRASGLTDGVGQLRYFQKFNRLYVASGTKIHSLDTSWNLSTSGSSYDLSLTGNDDGGTIRCYVPASDRFWIGTKRGAAGGSSNDSNPANFCSIYDWDGISNQVTKEYKIPAEGILAMIMENDIPIALDSFGVLRKFNGQGFVEIGRLPLRRNQSLLPASDSGFTQGFIHPRGLALTKEGNILALISNRTLYDYSSGTRPYENLPSGIWEFDQKGSATMKHALTYMPVSSTSVTDYGQNRVSLIGSLAMIPLLSTSAYGISQLFAGAQYYTDASSTNSAVFMDAPWPTDLVTYPEGQKYGYLVTPFILSTAVRDTWKKVYLQYKDLLDSGDKITVKYRTSEAAPVTITITWTSTTTFTTTTNVSGYVGYEVEVFQGKGSGKCSHITTVVNNAGTYTVTVDETYTGCTSGTALARLQAWVKAGAMTQTTPIGQAFNIEKSSSRIQLKICMQFTGDDELHQIALVNKTYQPLE